MSILCNSCVNTAEEEVEALTDEQIAELVGDGASEDEVDQAIIDLLCGKIITIESRNDPVIAQYVGNYMFYMCPSHYATHQMGL